MRTATRPVTEDPVVLRIIDMLELQGKTEKDLVTYLGLTSNMFTVWKYGNSKSYMKRIDMIAEYLGTTRKYLLNGTNGNAEELLTGTELKILMMYRELGNDEQELFLKVMNSLTDAYKYRQMQC